MSDYDLKWDALWDELLIEIGYAARWEAKGEARGEARGEEKGRTEVARNALAQGASPEFVQKITGLDIQTINSLYTG